MLAASDVSPRVEGMKYPNHCPADQSEDPFDKQAVQNNGGWCLAASPTNVADRARANPLRLGQDAKKTTFQPGMLLKTKDEPIAPPLLEETGSQGNCSGPVVEGTVLLRKFRSCGDAGFEDNLMPECF